MDRREALALTATLLGGTLAGSGWLLTGCSKSELLSETDVALLDEIGETILPASDRSPGARAAKIGEFMQLIVTDCYDETEQQTFIEGIKIIKRRTDAEYGRPFSELSSSDRIAVLAHFDQEAAAFKAEDKPHFFAMMKDLTIWGYFSSEPGVTQALRYNPIPGRYEGCVDYKTNQPAWF